MKETNDEHFMQLAISEAKAAIAQGDEPFGSVVVSSDGQVVATGRAEVDSQHDPTAHAEIQAIRAACEKTKSHKLTGCTLYTTCEPCLMCTSAIFWSKIQRVVIGATREDAPKYFGKLSFSTVENESKYLLTSQSGVLREKCAKLYAS